MKQRDVLGGVALRWITDDEKVHSCSCMINEDEMEEGAWLRIELSSSS